MHVAHHSKLSRAQADQAARKKTHQEDPKLRPTAEEALDFEWVAGGEAAPWRESEHAFPPRFRTKYPFPRLLDVWVFNGTHVQV